MLVLNCEQKLVAKDDRSFVKHCTLTFVSCFCVWLTVRLFSISLKAKDIQQMVKLEEEMDRRPATVVWATETKTQASTHPHEETHTDTGAEILRHREPSTVHRGKKILPTSLFDLDLLKVKSQTHCSPPHLFLLCSLTQASCPLHPPANSVPLSHRCLLLSDSLTTYQVRKKVTSQNQTHPLLHST